MPSDGKKEPLENLKDKFRSLFGSRDPKKKKDALPPKAHFSIWYFLIAFLLFTYLQQYFFSPKVETIPYSQFKQYLAEGNVSQIDHRPGKYHRNAERKRSRARSSPRFGWMIPAW